MLVDIALGVVTLASVAVAGWSWWHASKWAKLIAYGRIAVEYKGKVKLDAPFREWVLWAHQTRKDKAQPKALRGHVIYSLGGTRIALFMGVKPAKVKPVKPRPGTAGHQIRRGTWSATDESKQKAMGQAKQETAQADR